MLFYTKFLFISKNIHNYQKIFISMKYVILSKIYYYFIIIYLVSVLVLCVELVAFVLLAGLDVATLGLA